MIFFPLIAGLALCGVAFLANSARSEIGSPERRPEFPRSFTTGPLGRNNVLPSKSSGALLGLWPYESATTKLASRIRSRERALGRKIDIVHVHWAARNSGCDYGFGRSPFTSGSERWVARHGSILVMSWTHGWTIEEVNRGSADSCLVNFGRRAKVFGKRFLLRTYWEFNGAWMHWSGTGKPFIDAWKRTVTKIREGGGSNVGFVWSPAGGFRNEAFTSYPGDEWVDWVGVSAYNRNDPSSWCSAYHAGWCELRELLSHEPVEHPTVYDAYASRKPFIVAEWGSVEDPDLPGRKRQWFLNAGQRIKRELRGVRALTYFDVDVTPTENQNFRIDTSAGSLEGFRRLATDPYFNTASTPRPTSGPAPAAR